MTARWQVRIFDTSKTLKAVLDDRGGFYSASISKTVNMIGEATVSLNADDPRVDEFVLDGFVEFWRSNPEEGIDWYREWVSLYRQPVYQGDEDGIVRFRAHCVGCNELLDRRLIAYKDVESAEVAKSDVGETVLKEYVDENAGPSATTGNGRIRTGTFTGLAIESDAANGTTWAGARPFENLLRVCQEIAALTGVDFEIQEDGDGTFTFKVYDGQLGADRSRVGLVTATGLNGAGNAPVILSRDMGTLRTPSRTVERIRERNVAIILGKGESAERDSSIVEDSALTDDSTWNDRETLVNASDEDAANLDEHGERALDDLYPETRVDFEVVQASNQLYGRDYFMGDLVAVELLGVEYTMKVQGVDLALQDGKETIDFVFREVS